MACYISKSLPGVKLSEVLIRIGLWKAYLEGVVFLVPMGF